MISEAAYPTKKKTVFWPGIESPKIVGTPTTCLTLLQLVLYPEKQKENRLKNP